MCHRVAAALVHPPDRPEDTDAALSSFRASPRARHPKKPKAPFSSLRFHSYIVARSWPAINAFGVSCRERAKSMLNDVYNRRILELAGTIPRIGRLESPDASATAHSKLCGSTVTVDLRMDGDTIAEFAHEVKACALGQASSSIMARNVIGAKAGELKDLRE